MNLKLVSTTILSALTLSAAAAAGTGKAPTPAAGSARFLVQAPSAAIARKDIASVGGSPLQSLAIVNAVAARLNPWQADRLRGLPGVHVFQDRALSMHGGLLSSLTSTLSSTTSAVTSTATSAVSTTLVTANELPLASAVTTPVVAAASSSSVPQDGTGENTPTLLYQTNYPMLVGADTLQQAGITGRGVTIAVLDSGLWRLSIRTTAGACSPRSM